MRTPTIIALNLNLSRFPTTSIIYFYSNIYSHYYAFMEIIL